MTQSVADRLSLECGALRRQVNTQPGGHHAWISRSRRPQLGEWHGSSLSHHAAAPPSSCMASCCFHWEGRSTWLLDRCKSMPKAGAFRECLPQTSSAAAQRMLNGFAMPLRTAELGRHPRKLGQLAISCKAALRIMASTAPPHHHHCHQARQQTVLLPVTGPLRLFMGQQGLRGSGRSNLVHRASGMPVKASSSMHSRIVGILAPCCTPPSSTPWTAVGRSGRRTARGSRRRPLVPRQELHQLPCFAQPRRCLALTLPFTLFLTWAGLLGWAGGLGCFAVGSRGAG